jgi:hypothetical protein
LPASIVLLAPGRYSEVFVRLGCQPLTLTPDRVIVGHAYRIIREERDGFRLLVDLSKGDQAGAIAAVENVLARWKGLIGFSG